MLLLSELRFRELFTSNKKKIIASKFTIQVGILMTLDDGAGIIVKATLDELRTAADKVLGLCIEYIELRDGTVIEEVSKITMGDSIVFKEDIHPCPGFIAATKLNGDVWYVITESECPEIRCDTPQAMKCARLNAQNLKLLNRYFNPDEAEDLSSKWRGELAQDSNLQTIVDRATKRWTH